MRGLEAERERGVVDEDIDGRPTLRQLRHDRFGRRAIGHVEDDGKHRVSEFRDQCVESIAASTGRDDLVSFGNELVRDRGAEAGGGARDEDDHAVPSANGEPRLSQIARGRPMGHVRGVMPRS